MKARLGFPYEDPCHIFTAIRFLRGDIPIIHEWHGTQFSYFYLMPIVDLYLRLNGSASGIILFCRIIFAVYWIVFSLFLFIRTKDISLFGAFLVSSSMLLFVPHEVMSLYYNTIGVSALFISLVLIITAQKVKGLQYTVAGVFFSIAVTCCPFLSLVYILFAIICVIDIARRKNRYTTIWIWFTMGVLVSFALFLLFMLSRADLPEYIASVHHLFEDKEHNLGLIYKAGQYLISFCQPVPLAVLWFLTILIAIYAKHKKEPSIKCIGLAFSIIMTTLFVVLSVILDQGLFGVCIPCCLGIYCRICFEDELNKKIFKYIWVPGVLYSLCLNMTSNLGFASINSALSISSAASLIMLARCFDTAFIKQLDKGAFKRMYICTAVLLFFFFGMLVNNRVNYVFCESSLIPLDTRVDFGTAKGLLVSKGSYEKYSEYCNDFKEIKDDRSINKVLVISNEQWIYLEMMKDLGAYTTWLHLYEPDSLSVYFNENPEMMPDAVYIDKYYTDYSFFFEDMGYVAHESPEGGLILRHG